MPDSYPGLAVLPQALSPVATVRDSVSYVTRTPAQDSGELSMLEAHLPVAGATAEGYTPPPLFLYLFHVPFMSIAVPLSGAINMPTSRNPGLL